MKTKLILAIIVIIGFIVIISYKFSSAIDTPHNESNNVYCGSCHGQAILNSPFWGGTMTYDQLCLSCHYAPSGPFSDTYAPLVTTHSSETTSTNYGDWSRECIDCHDPHYQLQKNYKNTDASRLYLATGTITACLYNGDNTSTLTYSTISYKSGWDATKLTQKTSAYRRTVLFPNVNKLGYDYPIIAVDTPTANKITVSGNACTYLSPPATYAAMYGQYVKNTIDVSGTSTPVKFFDQTGTNSFADGNTTYDGICEVCHTQTTHYRKNGSGSDQHHMNVGGADATNCISCHPHTNGFAHGGGGGTGCGTSTTCHGTIQSHSTHVSGQILSLDCSECHNTSNFPQFRDGAATKETTTVCNNCHTTNGVSLAKQYWEYPGSSAGAPDSWATVLGEKSFCGSCHDATPGNTKEDGSGNIAYNILGNDTTYGFYVIGHGKTSGNYAKMSWQATSGTGNPAANRQCNACHNLTSQHFNNTAERLKTGYENDQANSDCNQCHPSGTSATADPQFYTNSNDYETSGHKNKLCTECHDIHGTVSGAYAGMTKASKQSLCYQCHTQGVVQNNSISGASLADDIQQAFGLTTKHVLGTSVTISGSSYTLECVSCHNVHVVTGKYWEADQGKSPLTRFNNNTDVWGTSSGQKMSDFAGPGIYQTPAGDTFTGGQLPDYPTFCSDCHNSTNTIFSPSPARQLEKFDWHKERHGGYVAQPNDAPYTAFAAPYQDSQLGNYTLSCTDCHEAHGSTNSYNIRTVVNNTAVTVTGNNNVNNLCHACHTNLDNIHHYIAGGSCALSCHSHAGSVYCTDCHHHGDTPSDNVPPSISNLSPSNGAGNVPIDTNLTFTISDNLSGIDWSTFQITLSGNKGYSKIYTGASPQVSKTGTLASYNVTVAPDANFGPAEAITVTINVRDRDGNSLVPPAWSFITLGPSDVIPPVISNLNPANGSVNVTATSNLTFTLSDAGSGINWDTFSISITGDKGYSENYTGASDQVSKTGTPASYNVTVDPDTSFGSGETITVTVNVDDFSDNALVPPAWSFITFGDATPPEISNLNPANGSVNVTADSNLTFTLSDDISGVDWSTFSISITGNKGYSENYTGTSPQVSETGTPASYDVTVDPDTSFGSGETITVTVNVDDLGGNALVPPAWSFRAVGPPAGSLDTSFGNGGITTTSFNPSNNDDAYALAIQSDGKLVLAGNTIVGSTSYFALARYTSTGSLDTSFNTTGTITTHVGTGDDYAYALAIQSDGKIVAGGNDSAVGFALARYTSTGSLDTSFNTTGKVLTGPLGTCTSPSLKALAIQSDGKIVAAGSCTLGSYTRFAIARYNANGSLDTSFNSTGYVTTSFGTNYSASAYTLAIQSDGKIVAAGFFYYSSTNQGFALARYTSTGSLDNTFGSSGMVTTTVGIRASHAYALAIQTDGKIVAAGDARQSGYFYQDSALVRYNTDGSLDSSFGSGGKVITQVCVCDDYAYALAIQSDGKLVTAGTSNDNATSCTYINNDFSVVRFNTNGSLDSGFGSSGIVKTPVGGTVGTSSSSAHAVAIQSDGKIVAAGEGGTPDNFAIVRYWP
jgi:predicted CXXCH cytochrome family protein